MEINGYSIKPEDITNVFFRMPPPDWLGWRSETDYIYEYVEYLRDRIGIVIPDHAVVLTDTSLVCMIKRCRIVFTTGDIDIFKYLFNPHTNLSMIFDGIGFKELSAIKEEYENEWQEN